MKQNRKQKVEGKQLSPAFANTMLCDCGFKIDD